VISKTHSLSEEATLETLSVARQTLIQLDETSDQESPSGMFKQVAILGVDGYTRLTSKLNRLATEDMLLVIHRRLEESERERSELLLEYASREQTLRCESEQRENGKVLLLSATWQRRYDEECERLRQETIRVQTELDIQLRSLSARLEVASAQQSESLQVIV
jgi:hypothetical protein